VLLAVRGAGCKVAAVPADDLANKPLSQLEAGQYYDSEGEAIRLLALAASEISGEMGTDDPRRIKKALDRLYEAVKKVADQFDARGFSVSIFLPLGVSVTVDWDVKRDRSSY
jgi:adenine deaminase